MTGEEELVDFHYHFCAADGLWTVQTSLESILADMVAHGICRRLVFQADESQNYASSIAALKMAEDVQRSHGQLVAVERWRTRRAPIREALLRARSRTPLEVAGVARQLWSRPGDRSRGTGTLARRESSALSTKFSKFHCEEDGSLLRRDFQALVSSSRLLVLHISPTHLERLMAKVVLPPSCCVLMAHLGSFGCDPVDLDRSARLVARTERLFVDTSGMHSLSVLRRYLPRFGDKVVFGTDGPAFSTRAALQVLSESGYMDQIRENTRRLATEVGLL